MNQHFRWATSCKQRAVHCFFYENKHLTHTKQGAVHFSPRPYAQHRWATRLQARCGTILCASKGVLRWNHSTLNLHPAKPVCQGKDHPKQWAFQGRKWFPLSPFNQNKLHTRTTIPPRSMTNDPNRESTPWQQRHAQKKEQIFVRLPKKGYLCIF